MVLPFLGLGLGSFASISLYEEIKEQLENDRKNNYETIQGYIETVKVYSDPAIMEETIDKIFKDYFTISKEVLNDFASSKTSSYCTTYVDTEVANLTEWFLELNPFGWEYF